MDWSDEQIERLTQLWGDGHSTAEIGRRMGLSKNQIVGKANRLDLPSRLSPIKRDGEPRAAQPRRVRHSAMLPPLPSYTLPPIVAAPTLRDSPPLRAQVQRVTQAPAPKYGRVIECCWPIGEPGTRDFRFCDAPSAPARPYCPEHVAIAYRAPAAIEDAA